jgi:hypothetical protein
MSPADSWKTCEGSRYMLFSIARGRPGSTPWFAQLACSGRTELLPGTTVSASIGALATLS